MNKGTKLQWIVTLLAFAISAIVLLSAGYEDRALVGAISFVIAFVTNAATVKYEKRKTSSSQGYKAK